MNSFGIGFRKYLALLWGSNENKINDSERFRSLLHSLVRLDCILCGCSRHLKKLNALLSQALSLQYLPKRTPVLVSNVSDAPSHFCPLKCEDDFLVDAHILKSGRHVRFFLRERDQVETRDFKILRIVEGVEVDLANFAFRILLVLQIEVKEWFVKIAWKSFLAGWVLQRV